MFRVNIFFCPAKVFVRNFNLLFEIFLKVPNYIETIFFLIL